MRIIALLKPALLKFMPTTVSLSILHLLRRIVPLSIAEICTRQTGIMGARLKWIVLKSRLREELRRAS